MDMVSLRAVFSQEANKEAHNTLYSRKNLLDGSGRPIRPIKNEAVQTLFALTRN